MPEICRFLGIVIAMYHREHGVPHFHAVYDDFDVVIAIKTGEVLEGELPKRALKRVLAWRELHVDELLENARLTDAKKQPNKIEPLE
jgi:Domain of unknown function (DUF4160)